MRYPEPEALLDQLAYLLDELQALRPLIVRVPAPLLEMRPMIEAPSIKERLGEKILAERSRFLPEVQRQIGLHPADTHPEPEDWNRMPVETLLDRLAQVRTHTLEVLHTIPREHWEPEGGESSLAARVYTWIQDDMFMLRAIGERLRESQLTLRNPG